MFLGLNDGRKELFQWDTGRKASVSIECEVVHFAHLNYGDSLAVEVVGGEVEIPNQLLTVAMPLRCWAFVEDADGHYTKQEQTIEVLRRAKPSDYLYTETEVVSVKNAVKQGLEEAKESGEFDGEKGDKGDKGDKGEDGKSAYEIAVDEGFEGTEQEWLDYLKKAQTNEIDEKLQAALGDIEEATMNAHDGIESHYGNAVSEIGSATQAAMEGLGNAVSNFHADLDNHYSYISSELDAIKENSIGEIEKAKNDAIDEIEAVGDIFSNALKGAVSGEVISVSDVSPLEHKMIVSVRGVLDPSIVKVKKLGKNILPYPYTRMNPLTTNGITFTPNDDRSITISGVATGNAYFQLWNAVLGGSFVGVSTGGTNGDYAFSPYVNYSKSNNNVSLYVANGTDLSTPVTIYPQIEKGTTVTDYEPYIEPVEYPVNADGTVEGVTPIYPTTTLMTDTAGAVIDCTYNRDINKAFAELQSIVNTLVGG